MGCYECHIEHKLELQYHQSYWLQQIKAISKSVKKNEEQKSKKIDEEETDLFDQSLGERDTIWGCDRTFEFYI